METTFKAIRKKLECWIKSKGVVLKTKDRIEILKILKEYRRKGLNDLEKKNATRRMKCKKAKKRDGFYPYLGEEE